MLFHHDQPSRPVGLGTPDHSRCPERAVGQWYPWACPQQEVAGGRVSPWPPALVSSDGPISPASTTCFSLVAGGKVSLTCRSREGRGERPGSLPCRAPDQDPSPVPPSPPKSSRWLPGRLGSHGCSLEWGRGGAGSGWGRIQLPQASAPGAPRAHWDVFPPGRDAQFQQRVSSPGGLLPARGLAGQAGGHQLSCCPPSSPEQVATPRHPLVPAPACPGSGGGQLHRAGLYLCPHPLDLHGHHKAPSGQRARGAGRGEKGRGRALRHRGDRRAGLGAEQRGSVVPISRHLPTDHGTRSPGGQGGGRGVCMCGRNNKTCHP